MGRHCGTIATCTCIRAELMFFPRLCFVLSVSYVTHCGGSPRARTLCLRSRIRGSFPLRAVQGGMVLPPAGAMRPPARPVPAGAHLSNLQSSQPCRSVGSSEYIYIHVYTCIYLRASPTAAGPKSEGLVFSVWCRGSRVQCHPA